MSGCAGGANQRGFPRRVDQTQGRRTRLLQTSGGTDRRRRQPSPGRARHGPFVAASGQTPPRRRSLRSGLWPARWCGGRDRWPKRRPAPDLDTRFDNCNVEGRLRPPAQTDSHRSSGETAADHNDRCHVPPIRWRAMSASGHKRKSRPCGGMSALPPKADIGRKDRYVR